MKPSICRYCAGRILNPCDTNPNVCGHCHVPPGESLESGLKSYSRILLVTDEYDPIGVEGILTAIGVQTTTEITLVNDLAGAEMLIYAKSFQVDQELVRSAVESAIPVVVIGDQRIHQHVAEKHHLLHIPIRLVNREILAVQVGMRLKFREAA
ncbi:MAG: hypothetical protein V4481_02485 [Patescibacteria group bacterium]